MIVSAPQPIRILTLTSLYPSAVSPGNGIFVETRLHQLLKRAPSCEARVVAPVPWFPSSSPRFGRYAELARIPQRELLHGIEVEHPRYTVIPRLSWPITPLTMAASSYPAVRRV